MGTAANQKYVHCIAITVSTLDIFVNHRFYHVHGSKKRVHHIFQKGSIFVF